MKSKTIKRLLTSVSNIDSWKDQQNRQALGKSDQKRRNDGEGEKIPKKTMLMMKGGHNRGNSEDIKNMRMDCVKLWSKTHKI